MASTNFGKYQAITANNTFMTIPYNTTSRGYRIYGTFSATVVIQIKRPDQATTEYSTIKTTTIADSGIIDLVGSWDIRIGTTSYTSGTVEVEVA